MRASLPPHICPQSAGPARTRPPNLDSPPLSSKFKKVAHLRPSITGVRGLDLEPHDEGFYRSNSCCGVRRRGHRHHLLATSIPIPTLLRFGPRPEVIEAEPPRGPEPFLVREGVALYRAKVREPKEEQLPGVCEIKFNADLYGWDKRTGKAVVYEAGRSSGGL